MKTKELTLKDKVKGFIIMNYHFMDFKIIRLKKEYELGKKSKDYLDGYVKGIEYFKDYLIKSDMKFLRSKDDNRDFD